MWYVSDPIRAKVDFRQVRRKHGTLRKVSLSKAIETSLITQFCMPDMFLSDVYDVSWKDSIDAEHR
jgi:hypothetical protein